MIYNNSRNYILWWNSLKTAWQDSIYTNMGKPDIILTSIFIYPPWMNAIWLVKFDFFRENCNWVSPLMNFCWWKLWKTFSLLSIHSNWYHSDACCLKTLHYIFKMAPLIIKNRNVKLKWDFPALIQNMWFSSTCLRHQNITQWRY